MKRTNLKFLSMLVCVPLLAAILPACSGEPTPTTPYKHVVVIGVDGAGAFFRDAQTPNLDKIFAKVPKLKFFAERVPTERLKALPDTNEDGTPRGLHLGSYIGNMRNLLGVEEFSYLLADDEDLYREIVDTLCGLAYQVAEGMLASGAKFDYAHFWEDICFKNGPLISPELFDKLCGKHYKKRCDLCHRYGIDVITLDCDGVVEQLLPTWFENGVNTMFPIEVGVWGDQFEPARKKFGNGMLGVGGMDKTAFLRDKAAVDVEIERMKRLASMGGFIPCPDHRLMPGTQFELVQYYAEEIKKIRI